MKTCSVDGCDKKHFGKGMCQAHYRVARRLAIPSEALAHEAAYRAANREKERARVAAWKAENPDKVAAQYHRRQQKAKSQ